MTMLGLQYVGTALAHWKKWRPKEYREMQKDGTLNERAQTASKEAASQVASLMSEARSGGSGAVRTDSAAAGKVGVKAPHKPRAK
jgi:hypothetical protein